MAEQTFSNKIKHCRKLAGLTQKEMSARTGIPKRTIENWEQGKNSCPDWLANLVIEKIKTISNEVNNGI